jgi:CubicO group peptidase (beta-lactamase class C family)
MRTIWVLAFLGLSTTAATELASSSADQDQPPIKAIFAPFSAPDSPGLAVLVKSKGQVLFRNGYGLRKLPTGARISPDTDFRLASCTKQFTALAVMLLVHDGKLQYQDRLSGIFPAFPPYGGNITIANLLNHTSGLPDYEDLMKQEEQIKGPIWSVEHQIQDEEVLRLLEQAPAGKFAPGTSWAYSNSGYVVLGMIVSKVSGMPYRDFLQQRIFAPAGMQHSLGYQQGMNEIPNRAFGHSLENGKWTETDQSSTSATLGDGGIYSNLEDLEKWDQALGQQKLLSAAEMAAAFTPVKLADGSAPRWPLEPEGDNLAPGRPVAYGFGWFLDPYKGHPRGWHTGSSMGFRTVIERFPDDRVTIIILANRSDADTKALADSVAQVLLPNNR